MSKGGCQSRGPLVGLGESEGLLWKVASELSSEGQVGFDVHVHAGFPLEHVLVVPSP